MTGPPLPPLTVITTCLATTRRKVVSRFPTLDNPKRKRVGISCSRRGVRPESPEGTSGRRRDDGRRCGGTCRGRILPSDRPAPRLTSACTLDLPSFSFGFLPIRLPAPLYSLPTVSPNLRHSTHPSITPCNHPPSFLPFFFIPPPFFPPLSLLSAYLTGP